MLCHAMSIQSQSLQSSVETWLIHETNEFLIFIKQNCHLWNKKNSRKMDSECLNFVFDIIFKYFLYSLFYMLIHTNLMVSKLAKFVKY
jgi:hypothetical protein